MLKETEADEAFSYRGKCWVRKITVTVWVTVTWTFWQKGARSLARVERERQYLPAPGLPGGALLQSADGSDFWAR